MLIIMRKNNIFLTMILGLTLSGCSTINPFDVENPNLTEESILNSGISKVTPWIAGLERQTALLYNDFLQAVEIASDNYQNTNTYYNQFLDVPLLENTDTDMNRILQHTSRLKEYAIYGLDVIVPNDETATDDQIAELNFFAALGHTLLGEVFLKAPLEPNEAVVDADVQFNKAIDYLEIALGLSEDGDAITGYNILLARVYRNLGDKINAKRYAEDALLGTPNYVRYVMYDKTNGPINNLQDALYDRGGFDDLQPLPRLDFLDPKFYQVTATEDADVPLIKIEEAYLILAEVELADAQLGTALDYLQDLVDFVHSERPIAAFDDRTEGRTEREPGSRPNKADILVAASAGESFIAGLVLERGAPTVTVPTISGTSILTADITVANYATVDAALELLYLLRQEIFIAEGRRMTDLGIKLPVSFNEIVSNPNIAEGSPETKGYLPSFIPTNKGMDAFTYDEDAKTCVIEYNMNKVLVQNKTSADVLPFF